MRNSTDHIGALDSELVHIIQDFLLLTPLSWPKETMTRFLSANAKGNLILPSVEYPKADYREKIEALSAYLTKLGTSDDPAIAFLRATAESYQQAYHILQGIGTQAVSEYSREIYGSPGDRLTGYARSNIDIAHYFIRVVEDYHCALDAMPECYSAVQLKRLLEKRIQSAFGADAIALTVDSGISARATAGPNYVKLRKGARFTENDLEQLFHHEVMIHTLTYLNGRKQPVLKSLGYNAPRTAATQEGLAVYAEYIHSSIELDRLKRQALRIVAIEMAEKGADFIELFRFFQSHGQNAEESYYSAMRIFRGGVPDGGIIFYKDNVYLRGLIEVGSFLKRAMHQGVIHDIALLFCGKLTTEDVVLLKPMVNDGIIIDPAHMPQWAKRSGELAAHLAINDLTERFRHPAEQWGAA